jgi:histidyl-tRNA synthetase
MTVTAAIDGAAGSATWADALLLSFAQAGYVQAEPAILQPAEPFLDLSGEDIRKSLYLTSDASGEELCLRPTSPFPVARDYLASAAPASRRLQLSRPGVPLSRRPAERVPAGRHRILRPAGSRRGGCRNAGAGAGGDRASA